MGRAFLILEDGTLFEGESLGAPGRTAGEVVFNTGMTGYQEILSDPSYAGQIVALTYPIIGNYGINIDDFESSRLQVSGMVVKETADIPSNWRSTMSLNALLKERGITAIQGVDTRALTRILRSRGVMMGAISTDETPKEALDRLASSPRYDTEDLNRTVTTQNSYLWRVNSAFPELPGASTQGARYRIALLDCGVKYNILRSLAALGCDTTVFPCTADAKELLQMNPDGIILSPGPGDPSNLGYVVNTVKQLIGKKPIMGVCLGTQILGCVFGSRTYKLKFGHRGSNHPVRDIKTGKVYITSQNHGYAVDADHLKDGMEVAQINLNDGTVEGLRHRDLPIISIQYHPEASPGPTDSAYFFKEFLSLIVSREESCYESASQIT